MGVGAGTHLVFYFWEAPFLVHFQLYILQGLRGGKWINLYQIEKMQP